MTFMGKTSVPSVLPTKHGRAKGIYSRSADFSAEQPSPRLRLTEDGGGHSTCKRLASHGSDHDDPTLHLISHMGERIHVALLQGFVNCGFPGVTFFALCKTKAANALFSFH